MTASPYRIAALQALPREFPAYQEELAASLDRLYGAEAAALYRAHARQSLTMQLHQDNMLAWAALTRGGVAAGMLFMALDGAQARVTLLHVLEPYRGEGVELLLMEHAWDALSRRGIDHILYDAAGFPGQELQALTEQCGFEHCPRHLLHCAAAAAASPPLHGSEQSRVLLPEQVDAAADCLLDAYAGHPDRALFHEISSIPEVRLFLQRAQGGAFGPALPGWMRLYWERQHCVGGIIACRIFPQTAFILQIFVRPAHQRRGIGARLIQELAAAVHAERNDMQLVLGVSASNPAMHLYQRLGFASLCAIDAYVWRRTPLS